MEFTYDDLLDGTLATSRPPIDIPPHVIAHRAHVGIAGHGPLYEVREYHLALLVLYPSDAIGILHHLGPLVLAPYEKVDVVLAMKNVLQLWIVRSEDELGTMWICDGRNEYVDDGGPFYAPLGNRGATSSAPAPIDDVLADVDPRTGSACSLAHGKWGTTPPASCAQRPHALRGMSPHLPLLATGPWRDYEPSE